MYNSTTGLVMYYTLAEMLSSLYLPFEILLSRDISLRTVFAAGALFGGIYIFNGHIHKIEERSGRDLVRS